MFQLPEIPVKYALPSFQTGFRSCISTVSIPGRVYVIWNWWTEFRSAQVSLRVDERHIYATFRLQLQFGMPLFQILLYGLHSESLLKITAWQWRADERQLQLGILLLHQQSPECPFLLITFGGLLTYHQDKLDWYACHPWMRYSLAVSAGLLALIIPRPTMIISLPLSLMTCITVLQSQKCT